MAVKPTVPIGSVATIARTINKKRRVSRFIGSSRPSMAGTCGTGLPAGLLLRGASRRFGWFQLNSNAVYRAQAFAITDHAFGVKALAIDHYAGAHAQTRSAVRFKIQTKSGGGNIVDGPGDSFQPGGQDGHRAARADAGLGALFIGCHRQRDRMGRRKTV